MKCVSQRRFCFLLQRYEIVIFIWGKNSFNRSNNCFITPFWTVNATICGGFNCFLSLFLVFTSFRHNWGFMSILFSMIHFRRLL